MKVYLRKMFSHDITHEVSVTETIISKFFEGERDNLVFVREGHEKGTKYPVLINKSKDARFGGQFKSVFKDDNVKEGDILAIKKREDGIYSLSVIYHDAENYEQIKMAFSGMDRHVIIDDKFLK
jgi:hypothetical protein